jgi:hypothetical protein
MKLKTLNLVIQEKYITLFLFFSDMIFIHDGISRGYDQQYKPNANSILSTDKDLFETQSNAQVIRF